MRRPRVSTLLLPVAITLSLTGCGHESTIDASSYERLNSSLNAARTGLPPKLLKRFDEARTEFNRIYFPNGKATTRLPDRLAPWQVVSGMSPHEFIAYARTLHPPQAPAKSPTFPSAAVASRLLNQYEHELALLREMRSQQYDRGRNTVDQFPVVGVSYLPPLLDAPVDQDRAVFLVKLRNQSPYDAYSPEFRLRVFRPDQDDPVLDRTFRHESRREPIGPGEEFTVTYECCSLGMDPLHNRAMKALPSDASIEVDLLQILGHDATELLDHKAFSLRDAQRMKVLELCIERISADVANWVPYARADEPGGCGDPDQTENLLAMWREEGTRPPEPYRSQSMAMPPAPTPADDRGPPATTEADTEAFTGRETTTSPPATPLPAAEPIPGAPS